MSDTTLPSLALIFLAAAVTPLLADVAKRVRIPAVVLEIAIGMVLGPAILGWVTVDESIAVLAEFGLTFLIFLAGYGIDVAELSGTPLRLATRAWLATLGLGLVLGTAAMASGLALSAVVIGLALTTTALGTLLPIVGDSGLLGTRFGDHVMAGGSLGEFGPIVAIALVLGSTGPARSAMALAGFGAVAALTIVLSRRPTPPRLERLMRHSLHSSGQLTVRLCVIVAAALVWSAATLGLDILLGAFTAGIVARYLVHAAHEPHEIELATSKLEAIGFGFLIPLFFVVTGARFDLDALLADASTLARLPLFVVLFLVVRGLPVLVLYRRELPARSRAALALMTSAALPLVVVITGIGVETGRMRPGNAAALVGAGMISVFVFPVLALALRPGGELPSTASGPDSEATGPGHAVRP